MSDLETLLPKKGAEQAQEKQTAETEHTQSSFAERKQKCLSMIEDAALDAVADAKRYGAFLGVVSRFDRYSPNNQLLIFAQNPQATQLKDFDAWTKEGGTVKKGSHGVMILTPKDYTRVGSIGVPCPDTYYKIVKPGTTEELDANFEGEICISGPSVMLRYVDNPEETANTLRRHEDGRIWLHTGDLGKMDEDGFVFFSQRMKRMIITSGYNVYPGQLENIIDGHEKVLLSCVIGVKDPYKVQKVKAFVVLRPGFEANDETKKELLDYCRQHIAKYAMPYDIEFRDELPKTLVGKVAYRILEEEEADRQATQEALQAAQEASENK